MTRQHQTVPMTPATEPVLAYWQVKAKKLKDPNHMISPTRLCIRNLPLTCDELQLKKVFVKALESCAAQHPATIRERKQKHANVLLQFVVVCPAGLWQRVSHCGRLHPALCAGRPGPASASCK